MVLSGETTTECYKLQIVARTEQPCGELLQMRLFESLLAASDELLSPEDQDNTKKEMIGFAARQWLTT